MMIEMLKSKIVLVNEINATTERFG